MRNWTDTDIKTLIAWMEDNQDSIRGPPHNDTHADMQDAGEENDDHPVHLRPESPSLSQVAPNPNSNELRESSLEANASINMQEVGLYGVGDEEEDRANGSDHHSPSPFPFSTPNTRVTRAYLRPASKTKDGARGALPANPTRQNPRRSTNAFQQDASRDLQYVLGKSDRER